MACNWRARTQLRESVNGGAHLVRHGLARPGCGPTTRRYDMHSALDAEYVRSPSRGRRHRRRNQSRKLTSNHLIAARANMMYFTCSDFQFCLALRGQNGVKL